MLSFFAFCTVEIVEDSSNGNRSNCVPGGVGPPCSARCPCGQPSCKTKSSREGLPRREADLLAASSGDLTQCGSTGSGSSQSLATTNHLSIEDFSGSASGVIFFSFSNMLNYDQFPRSQGNVLDEHGVATQMSSAGISPLTASGAVKRGGGRSGGGQVEQFPVPIPFQKLIQTLHQAILCGLVVSGGSGADSEGTWR